MYMGYLKHKSISQLFLSGKKTKYYFTNIPTPHQGRRLLSYSSIDENKLSICTWECMSIHWYITFVLHEEIRSWNLRLSFLKSKMNVFLYILYTIIALHWVLYDVLWRTGKQYWPKPNDCRVCHCVTSLQRT
jgi:hypothetical protein